VLKDASSKYYGLSEFLTIEEVTHTVFWKEGSFRKGWHGLRK
jgi:hypothetical protein